MDPVGKRLRVDHLKIGSQTSGVEVTHVLKNLGKCVDEIKVVSNILTFWKDGKKYDVVESLPPSSHYKYLEIFAKSKNTKFSIAPLNYFGIDGANSFAPFQDVTLVAVAVDVNPADDIVGKQFYIVIGQLPAPIKLEVFFDYDNGTRQLVDLEQVVLFRKDDAYKVWVVSEVPITMCVVTLYFIET